jgi:hypothetical protein
VLFGGILPGMKTKTRAEKSKIGKTPEIPNTVQTINRDAIQPENAPATPVLTEGGEERKSVAWYEKDGKILWDRMRPSTRDALKEFLERDDVIKALEVKRPEGPPKKLVGESLVARGYKLTGTVESFIAQKSLKAPKEIADKVMLFDDEELEVVVPPTVRLLNRYGADWIETYGDWVELGIGLTSIQLSKFAMLRALLDREERKAKNAPAPLLLTPQKAEETPAPPQVPEKPSEGTDHRDVEKEETSEA